MYLTVPSVLIPAVPWAPGVTPVTDGVLSNVSLANTAIVTAVFFLVTAASSAMSATGATVTVTVAVSVTPQEVAV